MAALRQLELLVDGVSPVPLNNFHGRGDAAVYQLPRHCWVMAFEQLADLVSG
jgi:hypothetical protein